MTIYLDVIFLENFIINFIILYAVGIETKTKIKFLKLMLASIVGSIYVVIVYLINNSFFCNIIMKILLSIVMIYIAYKTNNLKTVLKMILYFYLTSFVFGGGALALIYIANTGKISIQNGVIHGKYTTLTIMTGIIIGFVLIIMAFKLIKSKISKKDVICNIEIEIEEKKVKTKAMIDTGNFLKEPITNIPVVVVESNLLKNIIPNEILENIESILGGDLSKISESVKNKYLLKMKVIPFTSLGKENGMVLGIKAKEIKIEEMNETRKIEKVIIGLYNKKINKRGEYHALIGLLT